MYYIVGAVASMVSVLGLYRPRYWYYGRTIDVSAIAITLDTRKAYRATGITITA